MPASSSRRLDSDGGGDAIPIENPDGLLPHRPLPQAHGLRLLLLLNEFVNPHLMHKILMPWAQVLHPPKGGF